MKTTLTMAPGTTEAAAGRPSQVGMMQVRRATLQDCRLLAELNAQLLCDEGHRNQMPGPELEQRLRGWLTAEYEAVFFETEGVIVAYALYREQVDEVYLRQFFVARGWRRKGIGRAAVQILHTHLWPRHKRLMVDVLVQNQAAVAFWRAVGYQDYCLALEIGRHHRIRASRGAQFSNFVARLRGQQGLFAGRFKFRVITIIHKNYEN